MFDNPRKELEKLQQELLAAEAEQDETADLEPEEDYGTPVDWDEGDREPLSKSYTDCDDDTLIWQTEELEPGIETSVAQENVSPVARSFSAHGPAQMGKYPKGF